MKKGTPTRKIVLLALAIIAVIVVCELLLKQQANRLRPRFNSQMTTQATEAGRV